jgi:enoyl-CoA hydratase
MSDVLFEQRGNIGLVTLNRPQALNALNHAMCIAIHAQLAAWASDSNIAAVVIQGAGDKAFCAGGDVVGLHTAGKTGSSDWEQFFFDEYRLNHAISTFPKPYIALLDGITMGGGVGLAMHGTYRVASERFLFAMPETGIGLIPDVGGTHILAHVPGQIGMYLGLTGARLKAADAVATGLCTHFTPSDQIPALLDALVAQPQDIAGVLARFNQPAGDAPLLAQQPSIDAHFGGATVEAIMISLCLGDDWALGVRDNLLKLSPTSMKLSHRAVMAAKGQSLADCLTREYRIVCQIKYGTDFFEGVRAALIDKDRKPIWKPAALGDVTEDMLTPYFDAPAGGNLVLG